MNYLGNEQRKQQYCSANSNGLLKSNGPYRAARSGGFEFRIYEPVVFDATVLHLGKNVHVYQLTHPVNPIYPMKPAVEDSKLKS
jgi:hypothetical protein